MPPDRSVAASIAVRTLWACAVVFAVVSAMFALVVSTTPPEARALVPPPGAFESPPLREQYVDFVGSFLRFDWGTSVTAAVWLDEPIGSESATNVAAVAKAAPVTLAYVVPSALVAFGLALALGYVAARRPRAWSTRFSESSMYVLFSLPNFFLAAIIFYTLRDLDPARFPSGYERGAGVLSSNLLWLGLPTLVLTTHLVAGFFRYTRAETRESLREQYVKLVRAKGAGPRRVARHVFRAAALPLVTLFVTELLGVLLVAVFVIEVVFEVPGVGLLTYRGIVDREIELVMVLTVLFSSVFVLSNLFEDLAAGALDARVGAGD